MQITVFVKRGLAIMLCLIFFLAPTLQIRAAEIDQDYVLAEKNDRLELYYHPEKAHVLVKDIENGYVWDSCLPKEQMPEHLTDVQKQEMESLFSMTYSKADYFSSETTTCSLENEEYRLETQKIPGGFAYQIYMPDFDFQMTMEFRLNEYGMEVKIPEDGIVECVESGAAMKQVCEEIIQLLEARKDALVKVEEDLEIPNSMKTNVKSSNALLDEMIETLQGIENPVGIGSISESLLEQLDEFYEYLIGSSSEDGFYQNVILAENIDHAVKEDYRREMKLLQSLEIALKVKIAQMKEVPAITLVDLRVLPYFGSAGDSQEGYMLYPDGCGAITYFKESHGEFSSMYQADTYSALETDLDWEMEKDTLGLDNLTVPYFGMKHAENACVAYVTGGKAQSNIMFAPSGYVTDVNRIGAGFNYRQTVATSSIAGVWQSGSDVMVFQQEKQPFTASLQYMFLQGEEADYSGMANKLRTYMVENGTLEKSENVENKQLPLAIDLLGGYKEKNVIFNKYNTGTTFEQAGKIVSSVSDVPILCNYKGVFDQEYGKYPVKYNLASELGDTKELNEIANRLQENGGQLYLENNQLIADYDQSGYSEGELTISNRYQILNNEDKTKYLFSPMLLKNRYEEIIYPEIKSYEHVGLTETMMGAFVYPDYSKNHSSTRLETVSRFEELLDEMKNRQGAVAVNAGNDYTFKAADWLRNIPGDVSGYVYTDEAVPFYMMLVHGFKVYTTLPNNQFYNHEDQLLKAIEYGCIPYFSLTAESIEAGSIGEYTSEFTPIYEKIIEDYNEQTKALEGLTNVAIKEHSYENGIAIVEYEDGTKIMINYRNSEVNVDGHVIESKSFIRVPQKGVTELEEKEIKIIDKNQSERAAVYPALVVWIFGLFLISIVIFGGISIYNRHRS